MGGRDPVDGAFYLTAIRGRAPLRLRIVAAAQFHNIAICILDDVLAGDVVSSQQPHLPIWCQSKEFSRWIYHEVILLDVDLARKGHFAHLFPAFILRVIRQIKFLDFPLWIILNDQFQWPEDSHRPRGIVV